MEDDFRVGPKSDRTPRDNTVSHKATFMLHSIFHIQLHVEPGSNRRLPTIQPVALPALQIRHLRIPPSHGPPKPRPHHFSVVYAIGNVRRHRGSRLRHSRRYGRGITNDNLPRDFRRFRPSRGSILRPAAGDQTAHCHSSRIQSGKDEIFLHEYTV